MKGVSGCNCLSPSLEAGILWGVLPSGQTATLMHTILPLGLTGKVAEKLAHNQLSIRAQTLLGSWI